MYRNGINTLTGANVYVAYVCDQYMPLFLFLNVVHVPGVYTTARKGITHKVYYIV